MKDDVPGFLALFALTGLARVFGETGQLAVFVLTGAWLMAGAVVTWRRTPFRGVPVLLGGLGALAVWAAFWVSPLSELVADDPRRLAWGLPVLLVLGAGMSAAHKYDTSRHPRAHERYLEAMRGASLLDRLIYGWVPTIVIDPFSDPRSR